MGIKAHVLDDASSSAVCSLSKALVEKGLYDDAAAVYENLPAPADIHDVVAHNALAQSLLRHQQFEDGWFLIDRMLDDAKLTDRWRYGALIYKAIHYWLTNDVDACTRFIGEAGAIVQKGSIHDIDKSLLAYYYLLKGLTANRQPPTANRRLKPALYRDAAPDTLHVIGESHCLSPHGATVDLGGSLYRLESRLVMGCKAWHLAAPKENHFQRAYLSIANALPEGANLLVIFGEIDCRMDEGMFLRHKKTGAPLDDIIAATAGGFVSFVATLAARQGQQANICGVPAPHHARSAETPMADDDLRAYLDMIRRFNKAVEVFANEHGCGFVDLYSLTVGEGGEAGGSQHIDRTHLYPSVVHQALLMA